MRLRGRARKAVLVAHILAAGAWIGIDVVVAVLVFTAATTTDLAAKALSVQALPLFAVWPMFTAGLVSLVTGGWLALGSRYGLLRYWWVAVKLALNLLLVTLVVVALRPGLPAFAAQGTGATELGDITIGSMYFPPVVSFTALTAAVLLSVFKPWGRVSRRGGLR